MTEVIKSKFNYNNLIINLIIPGPPAITDQNKHTQLKWFDDAYYAIEREYKHASNLEDCLIYIVLIRPINWVISGDLILEIKKLVKVEGGKHEFKIVNTINEVKFSTPDEIADLFNKVLDNDIFMYTNTTLVIYGHGDGYYLFTHEGIDKTDFEYNQATNQNKFLNSFLSKTFNEVRNIFSKPREKEKTIAPIKVKKLPSITPNTLRKGIKKSMLKHIDLLIMTSCNMQNLDTIYTFADCASYIIGSEKFITTKPHLFKYAISNKKEIDFDFVKNIINLSYAETGDLNKKGLSAFETNKAFLHFTQLLHKIINYLVLNYDRLKKIIKEVRQEILYVDEGIGAKYFIDVIEWLNLLNSKLQNNDIELKSIIIEIYNLKNEFVYMNERNKQANLNGISIYYPKNKDDFKNDDYNSFIYMPKNPLFGSGFTESTKWELFLQKQFG